MPASDVRTRSVPIELDKTRHLRYDMNALCVLEEEFGDLRTAIRGLEKRSVKALRGWLHAGLVHEDPELTPQKVGAMLALNDLAGIADTIEKSLVGAMPLEKGKNAAAPPEDNPGAEK